MISSNKALKLIMKNVKELKTEYVKLENSIDRVLAQDIISDVDMPPFNKSAMDGYACRISDLKNQLKVIETIPAGYMPKKKVGLNECSKIMTGAIIPEGANCVIMIENTKNINSERIIFTDNSTRKNICKKGEDIKKGEVLIKKGKLIQPQHVAVLATCGIVKPLVFARPRVGIIATGSELLKPKEKLKGTFIRNSNSYQLSSQVVKTGGIPKDYGIAKDSKKNIDHIITKAIKNNDIVLISGGVSMGDYDFVPEIFKKKGINILFDRVAIKPGKPLTYGMSNDTYFFGLPGNPVSAFITFEIFVKPILYKLMGLNYKPLIFSMILGENIKLKSTERESFLPVKIIDNKHIIPIEYHGSADIKSLTHADGIISIPSGTAELKKGLQVNVRQI